MPFHKATAVDERETGNLQRAPHGATDPAFNEEGRISFITFREANIVQDVVARCMQFDVTQCGD